MESDRLFFREITENDAELIVGWRSDFETYRYFLNPHKITLEEHLNWYRNSYLNNDSRTEFIALKKDTNKPVGAFGLIFSEETVEVNYLLDKEYRGKGYAAEAVSYLIAYAKETRQVTKAIAEVHKENKPSLSLIERLGFSESKRDGDIIVFEKDI